MANLNIIMNIVYRKIKKNGKMRDERSFVNISWKENPEC